MSRSLCLSLSVIGAVLWIACSGDDSGSGSDRGGDSASCSRCVNEYSTGPSASEYDCWQWAIQYECQTYELLIELPPTGGNSADWASCAGPEFPGRATCYVTGCVVNPSNGCCDDDGMGSISGLAIESESCSQCINNSPVGPNASTDSCSEWAESLQCTMSDLRNSADCEPNRRHATCRVDECI